jgi:ssDNA-binding Zn-finger/Zn-ribbon topoisomerase 1
MVLKKSTKYFYSNGCRRNFYSCSQYPVCRGTQAADEIGRPIGVAANAELKALRSKVYEKHIEFMRARQWDHAKGFYRWLARRLGLGDNWEQARINFLNAEQCNKALEEMERTLTKERRKGHHA